MLIISYPFFWLIEGDVVMKVMLAMMVVAVMVVMMVVVALMVMSDDADDARAIRPMRLAECMFVCIVVDFRVILLTEGQIIQF